MKVLFLLMLHLISFVYFRKIANEKPTEVKSDIPQSCWENTKLVIRALRTNDREEEARLTKLNQKYLKSLKV